MKLAVSKALTILSKTPLVFFLIAVFVLGYMFRNLVADAPIPIRNTASADSADEAEE